MCQGTTTVMVQLRLTTSMIPHYQNDENNVQGTRTFNNINDTPQNDGK